MQNIKLFENFFGGVSIADVRYVCVEQVKLHDKQIKECTDERCKEIYTARQDAFQTILDYVNGVDKD